jgi:predicted ester cyclase
MSPEDGIAVVRRNTEEVQRRAKFIPRMRGAFPDFHAEIHWQISDGDRVATFKTYHGTHEGTFWGLAAVETLKCSKSSSPRISSIIHPSRAASPRIATPTGRKIHFETVDVMRVRNGKITDHWGVANLLSLAQQLGLTPALDPRKKG